jgi:RNA polymerase sigma-70 factor, ECF subfamily
MLTPDELVGLLAAVAKGDQGAFERLYVATRAKLYGVVLRILRRADLADEVMQDTYLKIWRSAGEFDPHLATPITWMVAIARHRALDLVRKKSETSIEDEPVALQAQWEVANPLEQHETNEQLRRLLVCLDALETERRELILLAYFGGFSREQLAAKFAAPVNTVKTWLRRSLVRIRECLGS